MELNPTNNLTPAPQSAKNSAEKVWRELRHPVTRRFIGKYCPQTEQLEVSDRGKRGVIDLQKE